MQNVFYPKNPLANLQEIVVEETSSVAAKFVIQEDAVSEAADVETCVVTTTDNVAAKGVLDILRTEDVIAEQSGQLS